MWDHKGLLLTTLYIFVTFKFLQLAHITSFISKEILNIFTVSVFTISL